MEILKAKEWEKLDCTKTNKKKADGALLISGFKTKNTTSDKYFIMIKGPGPIHQGDITFQIWMDLTWAPHLKGKNRPKYQ